MSINQETKEKIRESFQQGNLYIKSVDCDTQEVFLALVNDVLKHQTEHKKAYRVTLETGNSIVVTEDHSLFTVDNESNLIPIRTEFLAVNAPVVCMEEDKVVVRSIAKIEEVNSLIDSYDLSVPETENFFCSNGILAHNSYSIGGISLDIERSSKYESLKGNAEGQLDKAAEIKSRTTKITRGLQQPRYGRGVRSSFGPAVGRGVLTPRNFL